MNIIKILFVSISVLKLCFAISIFEPFKENHFVVDQISRTFEDEIRHLGKNVTQMPPKYLAKRSADYSHVSKRSIDESKLSKRSTGESKLSKRSNDESKLSKRSIGEHYEDSHCVESFETSDKTIIRTIESKSNGAVFLNNTEVETYERCLRFCCETNLCTVAVWDQQVSLTCHDKKHGWYWLNYWHIL